MVVLLAVSITLALTWAHAEAVAAPPWTKPQQVSKKGHRWLSQQPVALGANGYALVAWTEGKRSAFRGARPWVAVRRPGGSAFRRRAFGPRGSQALAVGIAEEENVAIVLTRRRGVGLLARLHSPGPGWAPAQRITRARTFNSFDIAPDGTAVVAWSNPGGVFASVRPPGGAFGPPLVLAEERNSEVVAATGVGGAVAVAWHEGGIDDDHPVVRARSSAVDEFEPPLTLPGTVGRFVADIVVTDHDVVVLTEDIGPAMTVVASRMPWGSAFEAPVVLSRSGLNVHAMAGADSTGRLIASWQRETRRNAFPLGPDAAIRDPAGTWSAPQAVFARPGSILVSMDVAGGGTAGLSAVRQRQRRRSLWASVAASGGTFGRAERVTVIRSGRSGAEPYVAVNDAGEALVAWSKELIKRSRLFVSSRRRPPTGAIIMRRTR